MHRIVLKFLNNLIYKTVISYKVNYFYYLRYFNFLLWFRNLPDRVKAKFTEDGELFFFIKNNYTTKQFAFRKQGLMAFHLGINSRGDSLANAYLINQINFDQFDIVIDIGANTGDLYIYFNNLNKRIKYFGFEPGIKEFKCLRHNVGSESCQNIALGDRESKMKFYYKPEFGDSSLIEMADFSSIYEVDVRKLDNVLQDLALDKVKIKLLKLEAEGAEPEILLGMKESLMFFEYVSVDLGFERGVLEESTLPQVTNFLLSNGFVIQDISKMRLALLFKNSRY